MRKNRNSFFSESNMAYEGFNPNMPMNPYQSGSAYNSFYSGPNPAMNNYQNTSEIDSRLAKIERQINRLEHRISKLETTSSVIDEIDSNTTNMYML